MTYNFGDRRGIRFKYDNGKLTKDLRAYWPLNETQVPAANGTIQSLDVVGDAHLTRYGAGGLATVASGPFGRALSFPQPGSPESLWAVGAFNTASGSFSGRPLTPQGATASMSIALWFYAIGYMSTSTNNASLFSCLQGSTGGAGGVFFLGGMSSIDNALKFEVKRSTGSAGPIVSIVDTGTLWQGAWHFVVGVVDGTANLVKISADGSTFTTATHNDGIAAGDVSTIVPQIGGFNGGALGTNSSGFGHYGYMAHAGIWHRALTQDEVTLLYNSGNGNPLLY